MAYDAANRLVTQFQATNLTTYVYDNNGSLTNEQSPTAIITSTYDREIRLAAQNASGTRTTFTYDGDGLRRRTQSPTGITTYIWDATDYLGETN